jgi:hypothetical protein
LDGPVARSLYRRTAGPEFDKASKKFFIAEGEKGVKLSGDSSLMCAALAHTFAAAGKGTQQLRILLERGCRNQLW